MWYWLSGITTGLKRPDSNFLYNEIKLSEVGTWQDDYILHADRWPFQDEQRKYPTHMLVLTPFSEPFFLLPLRSFCISNTVSNACQVAPISLFLDRMDQRITGNAFWNSLHSDWQIDTGYFNMPIIMARTQILVHRWGPRTRTLALFRRRT